MNGAISTDEREVAASIRQQRLSSSVDGKPIRAAAKMVSFNPEEAAHTVRMEVNGQPSKEQVTAREKAEQLDREKSQAAAQEVEALYRERLRQRLMQHAMREQQAATQNAAAVQLSSAPPQMSLAERQRIIMMVMGGCFAAGAFASWWFFGRSASAAASAAAVMAPSIAYVDLAAEDRMAIVKSVVEELTPLLSGKAL